MKHKVGDKVRIKSLDWYNENKNRFGSARGFTLKMSEYCGKTSTIVKVGRCHYELDIDDGDWYWTDEMFDENYMERIIGETFEHEGIKLQCVENESCNGCFFYNNGRCLFEADMDNNGMGICSCRYRKDG